MSEHKGRNNHIHAKNSAVKAKRGDHFETLSNNNHSFSRIHKPPIQNSHNHPSAGNFSTPKGDRFEFKTSLGKTRASRATFGTVLSETRPERTAIKYKHFQKLWDGFKKKCRLSVKKGRKQKSLFYKTEEFPAKLKLKEANSKKDLSDAQSGLNKWLFSLKKSNDSTRKHYEVLKCSGDPNRVLWAHINEVKQDPIVKILKPKRSQGHARGIQVTHMHETVTSESHI